MISETQRELLQTALEEGYFTVPREATLLEIAEENGLSDVETSREIRRGIETILRESDDI